MDVRLYERRDRDALQEMAAAHAADMASHLEFRPDVLDATLRDAERATPTIFVAEGASGLAGYIFASIHGYYFASGVWTCLDVLYVEPGTRGSRAAAMLTHTFLDWSRRLPAREAFLCTSSEYAPERVARFFAKMGAEPNGPQMKVRFT